MLEKEIGERFDTEKDNIGYIIYVYRFMFFKGNAIVVVIYKEFLYVYSLVILHHVT